MNLNFLLRRGKKGVLKRRKKKMRRKSKLWSETESELVAFKKKDEK